MKKSDVYQYIRNLYNSEYGISAESSTPHIVDHFRLSKQVESELHWYIKSMQMGNASRLNRQVTEEIKSGKLEYRGCIYIVVSMPSDVHSITQFLERHLILED